MLFINLDLFDAVNSRIGMSLQGYLDENQLQHFKSTIVADNKLDDLRQKKYEIVQNNSLFGVRICADLFTGNAIEYQMADGLQLTSIPILH